MTSNVKLCFSGPVLDVNSTVKESMADDSGVGRSFLGEDALNVLREEMYFRTQELRESDDRGLGIDHSVDVSDEEVEKADCQVDHDRFVLLAEWRSLEKFVSAKEDLVRMIENVYDDAYQRLESDELDEDFVLFEFRRMLVRQKAEILAARRYLDMSPSSSTLPPSQPQE